jgi:hypothetical protein
MILDGLADVPDPLLRNAAGNNVLHVKVGLDDGTTEFIDIPAEIRRREQKLVPDLFHRDNSPSFSASGNKFASLDSRTLPSLLICGVFRHDRGSSSTALAP